MTDELLAYLRTYGGREREILRRLREETATHEWARMQISPEQGFLLELLVRLIGVHRAIEIGVFTGYSSLCIAAGMAAGGRLIACDINADWTATARRYWREAGLADRIDLRLRPAIETLAELQASDAGRFDFAFIDADKENYEKYFEACLALLRPGGLIAVDNTLWSGRVIDASVDDRDTRAIRAFNERVRTDERVDLAMVPVGDGLTLLRKR